MAKKQVNSLGKVRVNPLTGKSVMGDPGDPCCCAAPTSDCCPILCGDTPDYIDVTLQTTGFADWFNAIPLGYRYRDPIYNVGTGKRIVYYTCNTDFAYTVRCYYTSTGAPCVWSGETSVTGAFTAQYENASGGFDTVTINGKLKVSVSLSKVVTSGGVVTMLAECYAHFDPDRVGAHGEPTNTLKGPALIPNDGYCCGCGNSGIMAGSYTECPMSSLTTALFTNQFKWHNQSSGNGGHVWPCYVIGSAAPGGASLSPGTTLCTRNRCADDCGDSTSAGCPTLTEFQDCIGCTNPTLTISTDLFFSQWDLFTYLNYPSEYADLGYIGNGDPNNIFFRFYCNGGTGDNGGPLYSLILFGKDNGIDYPGVVTKDDIEGDPDTGCPPLSFVLNSGNTRVWNVEPGMTEITVTIGC